MKQPSRFPTEKDTKCPSCGAPPGKPCYGGGPMPPNSHKERLLTAHREEITRLRNQLTEQPTTNQKDN